MQKRLDLLSLISPVSCHISSSTNITNTLVVMTCLLVLFTDMFRDMSTKRLPWEKMCFWLNAHYFTKLGGCWHCARGWTQINGVVSCRTCVLTERNPPMNIPSTAWPPHRCWFCPWSPSLPGDTRSFRPPPVSAVAGTPCLLMCGPHGLLLASMGQKTKVQHNHATALYQNLV